MSAQVQAKAPPPLIYTNKYCVQICFPCSANFTILTSSLCFPSTSRCKKKMEVKFYPQAGGNWQASTCHRLTLEQSAATVHCTGNYAVLRLGLDGVTMRIRLIILNVLKKVAFPALVSSPLLRLS